MNGEDSFEATRRELTVMLFDAHKHNHELAYGLEKVLISLSAGSLLFSMTFISALAPGSIVWGFYSWRGRGLRFRLCA